MLIGVNRLYPTHAKTVTARENIWNKGREYCYNLFGARQSRDNGAQTTTGFSSLPPPPPLLFADNLRNLWHSQSVLEMEEAYMSPWRYRLWRTLAAAAGSLSRLHQTVLGWHVISTSNPTAAFSAFQTGPLLLYSSNYSVYPITRRKTILHLHL
jgi:hypothetical protein